MSDYLGLKQVPIFEEKGDFHVTSPFGYRIHPITHKVSGHTGIDGVRNEHDLATIVAIDEGEVIDVCDFVKGYSDVYTKGNYVRIEHKSGRQSLYLHLKYGSIPSTVKVGAKLNKREKIGIMGDTGRSTNAHIHFQVYDIDGQSIIDPTPFLLGKNINEIDGDYMYIECSPCKYKDNSKAVYNLQLKITQLSSEFEEEVKSHSYSDGQFDGVFGKGLVETVKKLQGLAGLEETGECDERLCEVLNSNQVDLTGKLNTIKEIIS